MRTAYGIEKPGNAVVIENLRQIGEEIGKPRMAYVRGIARHDDF